MPEYKFYYFGLHARGEPIRMLLAHAGADWEDVRVTFEEWPQLKPSMPNGQVPCLEVNGKKMGQSNSILRYIGMKLGYYPEDPMQAYESDMLSDAFADVQAKIYLPHFENDPAVKKEKTDLVFETLVPNFLKVIEPICAKGQFLVGEKLTCADFWIGGLYVNYCANELCFERERWNALLEQFPAFKAYGERFAAANESYLSTRGKAPI